MSGRLSLWARIMRVFRPPTETYETRRNHPAADRALPTQKYEATDQRRNGGSSAIGS